MNPDQRQIEQMKGEIDCLKKMITLLVTQQAEFKGNLSPSASFTLSIDGPYGKKELGVLIKRLQLESKAIGDARINETTGQTVHDLITEALNSDLRTRDAEAA